MKKKAKAPKKARPVLVQSEIELIILGLRALYRESVKEEAISLCVQMQRQLYKLDPQNTLINDCTKTEMERNPG